MSYNRAINLGEMDKIISIGNYFSGTDDFGMPIDKFVEKYTDVWCRVKKLSLRKTEVLKGEGVTGFNCLEFTIRAEDNISYSDVVKFNNVDYDIIAIEPLDDNFEFLIITGQRVMK